MSFHKAGIILIYFGIGFGFFSYLYFDIFGKQSNEVILYSTGEVKKSSIQSLESTFYIKDNQEIKIPTSKLIIVEMTENEEKQYSKNKKYYPNFLYTLDSKVAIQKSNLIPDIVKDFSMIKNYKDYLIYQVDNVTYKKLKTQYPDLKYIKTLGILKRDFNVNKTYSEKDMKELILIKEQNSIIMSLKEDDLFYKFFFSGFIIVYILIILVLIIESKDEKRKRLEKIEFKKAKKEWKIPS